MLFSGTATTTRFNPWCANLSSAMNIKARLLPDAGGALISRNRLSRAAYAFACISRIPSSLVADERPVCSYCMLTISLACCFMVRLI